MSLQDVLADISFEIEYSFILKGNFFGFFGLIMTCLILSPLWLKAADVGYDFNCACVVGCIYILRGAGL